MRKNLSVLFSVFLLLGGGVKAVNAKAENANESVGVYEQIEEIVQSGVQNAENSLQIHAKFDGRGRGYFFRKTEGEGADCGAEKGKSQRGKQYFPKHPQRAARHPCRIQTGRRKAFFFGKI